MPLRALLDGKDVIAPLLSDVEWETLRREARMGKRVPILPCCHRPAYQRTSPLGLRHFYHPARAQMRRACGGPGETQAHLLAKYQVMQGCLRAGHTVQTEWAEDGWRADVLASKGDTRIAFEIQLGRLPLVELERRQERYRRSGVRGCWFCLDPPEELRRSTASGDLEARRELPVFELERDVGHTFLVHLNGRRHLLDLVAQALLEGKIAFRAFAMAAVEAHLILAFFRCRCWKCSGLMQVYRVMRWEYRAATTCSTQLYWTMGRQTFPGEGIALEFQPPVRTAVQAILQSEQAELKVRIRRDGQHPTSSAQRSWCFACPDCKARLPEVRLPRRPDKVIELHLDGGRHQVAWPHWCSAAEAFCD